MKSSLELTKDLHDRGALSPAATTRVLEKRNALIKKALAVQTAELFKVAGFFGNVAGKIFPGAAPKPGLIGGLLDKFKSGNLTPALEKSTGGGVGWGDVAANLIKLIGLAGLTAGATAGVGALIRHSKDKRLNNEIKDSYKQMFDEVPRLKDLDPHKVDNHFGVLVKYAPALAANPIVAGSFVESSASMNTIDINTIKALAETQHRIDDTASPTEGHFDRGVSLATRSVIPWAKGPGV